MKKVGDLFSEISAEELQRILDKVSNDSADKRRERKRIADLSAPLVGSPPEEWPEFEITWDFNPDNFNHAFDGISRDEFRRHYPHGMLIAWVSLEELDLKLARGSQRSVEETWSIGFPDKVASAILHWIEGHRMTPPAVVLSDGFLNIHGGNHRLVVCRAKGVLEVPILVPSESKHIAEAIDVLPLLSITRL